MVKIRNLIFIYFFYFSNTLLAQDVFGNWKTIDDKTGEAKSIVNIYKKDNKVYGKVVNILDPSKKDALCIKCKGKKYNKPVLGMVIIEDLKKDDDGYKDGEILDPENGKTYTNKIWLDPDDSNILNVRGYVAFFYRTQRWIRVD